jgi:hypothetical protein
MCFVVVEISATVILVNREHGGMNGQIESRRRANRSLGKYIVVNINIIARGSEICVKGRYRVIEKRVRTIGYLGR